MEPLGSVGAGSTLHERSLAHQLHRSRAASRSANSVVSGRYLRKDGWLNLKANGYRIVFMKPKFPVTTITSYDDIILKQMKTSGGDGRPTSSVVRTISE